ncbi:MAG: hypothetical protein H8E42_08030 [Nitrospinae bacterium]|nr:hypothetical protein [Nitrospinota bacterium]MBL7019197.1 hypothetical protein [Nitrospinaceae bacterium]
MTTVFLSGSRQLNRLNDTIKARINNMVEQNFLILVGDANGADKAMQQYLTDSHYSNVKVFCAGNTCRNNTGNWDVTQVYVDSKLNGRDFYTAKDKEMAAKADYGFVLWDGKSSGAINNVFELLKYNKQAVIYFSPEKEFHTISHLNDAKTLLNKCDPATVDLISKKIKLPSSIADIQKAAQGNLALS